MISVTVSDSQGGQPPPQALSARATWVRQRVAAVAAVLLVALTVLPVALYVTMLLDTYAHGNFAIDFRQTFLPAAEKLSHGQSPYPAYAYPPLVAFGLVPFAFLPAPDVVFVVLLIACVPLSLWLLGVRDWRCYPAAFLWGPTFHAVQTGNVSILLLLGFAVCWRFRQRARVVTVVGGLTVAAKIICWPLVLWLASTRRYRGAVGAVIASLIVTFGFWAAIGFSGLLGLPSDLNRLSNAYAPDSYTVKAVFDDLGSPEMVGRAVGVMVAIAVLGACALAGWRGDDRRSFAFAVVGAIVVSPIIWLHSFVLLLAVVALYRPRLSPVWLLPTAMWFASGNGNGALWQTFLVLGVASAVVVICVITPSDRPSAHVDPSRLQQTTLGNKG